MGLGAALHLGLRAALHLGLGAALHLGLGTAVQLGLGAALQLGLGAVRLETAVQDEFADSCPACGWRQLSRMSLGTAYGWRQLSGVRFDIAVQRAFGDSCPTPKLSWTARANPNVGIAVRRFGTAAPHITQAAPPYSDMRANPKAALDSLSKPQCLHSCPAVWQSCPAHHPSCPARQLAEISQTQVCAAPGQLRFPKPRRSCPDI